ncbi:hypothetical protein MSSIT_3888 [Methanosarcina siciliae T4/M]|uniref:DUF1673 domain-containing protein n=1 Tax=Methanosarcina siciliae T4/M TaxID=1434120 RepID=A0A0E3P9E6_9EURY|nr:DUF1673 family protein [Methanosarcina siciliae]AKB30607.1 hypothetical protein MSSIT_3888 [Methanosarcina siciliae T4/M]
MAFIESIRKMMGWCPNAKAPRYMSTKAEYENARKVARAPGPETSPDPAGIAGRDQPGYRENILLILLALVWLLPIAYRHELLPIFIILSAAAMYYDAQNIRAGNYFEKETFLGNIVTWRPISWGVVTAVGGVIIMAIYLFHRKEIFNANN